MRGRSLSRALTALPRPRTVPQYGLVAVVVAYATAFSYWTCRSHDGLGTWAFDFGIYDQGLWLLSRFHAPFVTVMGRNLFGDHTSFILLPLVPIYWVLPSPKVLLVAQSLALAVTAVPVFLIARRRLEDEWLALVLGAAVLLQPALQWTNFEQFHPDCCEVPIIGFLLYYMLEKRWPPYFVCVGLLLSVKEDAALVVLVIGLYVALRGNRKIGLVTAAAAVSWGVFAVYGVLRLLNGVGSLNGWRIPFGGVWGTIRTAFAHPRTFFHYVTSDERPTYLWQLFAPLALLPLLAPEIVLLAIGAFASNLISNFYYQHRIQYHYSTLIIPVLAVAAVVGTARLRGLFLRSLACGAVAFASLAAGFFWGPMPGLARHPTYVATPGSPEAQSLAAASRLIPSGASVSAYYSYLPHLDHRVEIYDWPVPFKAVYWGVFDREGQRLPQADHVEYVVLPTTLPDDSTLPVLQTVEREFVMIYRSPYVTVLRRR